MTETTFEKKWDVCIAALPVWTENPDLFSFEILAEKTGIPLSEIAEHFSTPEQIPRFFYEAAIELYHEQRDATDGFEAFSLSEKLIHFSCSLFDILDSQKEFVSKSLYPVLLEAPDNSFFSTPVSQLFQRFVEGDDRVSSLTKMWTPAFVFEIWAYELGHVLRFWLKDTSENKEKTLALLDKLTAFLQELYYNTAADRGLDLAKFVWQEGIVRVPFGLDSWLRK